MADQVGNAVLKISLDEASAKRVFEALDKLTDENKKTADSAKGIGQALNLAIFEKLGTIALEATKKIAEGIIYLGERGADVDDVSHSFEVLAAQAGSTGNAMLTQLRAGVVGTMNDFDLMKAANTALGAGLVHSADDMGTLAAGARVLAKATGDSTAGAFDKLTDAMAKGRVSGLKTMGLYVDSNQAVLKYAQAHGVAVSSLTDEEKAAAVTQAALAALRERLKALPPDAADFGEKIQQAKVKLENFRDELAVAVSRSPVFAAAMDAAGKGISTAFGNNQQQAVTTVTHLIEQVAIVAVKGAGLVVEAARFMTNAWFGMQVGFNVVAGGVASGLSTIVGGIATMLEAASKVPKVGDEFKAPAASVRAFADDLKNLSGGFKENATAALDNAATTNAAFDQAKAVVDGVVAAMEAASGQAVKTGQDTKGALDAVGKGSEEAARKVKDNTKQIAEAMLKLSQDILLDQKTGLEKRLAQVEAEKQQELLKAKELTGGVGAEYQRMVDLIGQRARQRVALEIAAGDEIKQHELQLQNEIALSQATGTQRQVMELQHREQAELQSIEHLRITRAADFAQMSLLIHQKYAEATAIVTGHYATVEQAAAAAGFKTRAELQETAEHAKRLYAEMLASGKFTDEELKKSHEAAMTAQAAVDDKVHLNRMQQMDLVTSSASSMLRSIFGKSKAAAIAAAIIDTYAAVAKALSAYPWPLNLVPAAAALAAGMAQVNQIRSQNAQGFKTGTPGLDFHNFGSATATVLHNQEAVIPRGSGHVLAGEIAAAMPAGDGGESGELVGLVRTQVALMQDLPRQIGRAVRNAVLMSPRMA